MYTVDKDEVAAIERRFRQLPKELKNQIRRYQRSEVNPIWREEMKAKSGVTPLHQRAFKTGNSTKAGGVITLKAGGSSRKLSGGTSYSQLVGEVNFGTTKREAYTKYYRMSPKGERHTVTRRTRRQLPQRRKTGYVVYQAGTTSIQRIASLHVQTITKTIYEAIEK